MKRILFLLKARQYSQSLVSFGLINSANHIADYLESRGYKCKVVQVVDSNSIDKEVSEYRPGIVVIEALWVTAHKLRELMHLQRYEHIKWIVRVHSEIGYLASESHGLKLLNDYVELHHKNLTISLNNENFVKSLSVVRGYNFAYLPNVITTHPSRVENQEKSFWHPHQEDHMHIGCFGALRLLKNQCFQAMCAVMAADKLGKKLFFHITPNLSIHDDAILNNLREIFRDSKHDLIVHNWMPNCNFQELVRRMDIGLQLSYTESFNIVSADFVNNNKLIVVSDAVSWMPPSLRTSTIDYADAVRKIIQTYERKDNTAFKHLQSRHLNRYNEVAKEVWNHFIHHLHQ